MKPERVIREHVKSLRDLPNVGPATEGDLHRLGIRTPDDLRGRDAWQMYEALCAVDGARHDPCVIDVFLSLTDFMGGGEPQPWWHYTAQRKATMAKR